MQLLNLKSMNVQFLYMRNRAFLVSAIRLELGAMFAMPLISSFDGLNGNFGVQHLEATKLFI